jgi:hypothetical protein
MKKLHFSFFFLLLVATIISCKKDTVADDASQNPTSTTAQYSITCPSNPTTTGTYTALVPLTTANTVSITINVTKIGTYDVTTTNNGVTFTASGSFTAVGANTLLLKGAGTPTSQGLYNYSITSSNGVVCLFYINYGVIFNTCNVANNTSVANAGGLGANVYTSVSGFGSGGNYTINTTSNSNENLTIRFIGDNAPVPGNYTSTGGYFPSDATNVAVFHGLFPQTIVMKQNFLVNVALVNGKTQITYCSCNFFNPYGAFTITISGKITLP